MRYSADWSLADLVAVYKAIHSTTNETKTNGKQWVKHIDPLHVYTSIAEGRIPAVINKGYLVAFDVSTPWYNRTQKILNELLVLRIDQTPGRFRDVIDTLEAVRAEFDCDAIVVGDALQPGASLARIYQRHGFIPQAHELMRGRPHG